VKGAPESIKDISLPDTIPQDFDSQLHKLTLAGEDGGGEGELSLSAVVVVVVVVVLVVVVVEVQLWW